MNVERLRQAGRVIARQPWGELQVSLALAG